MSKESSTNARKRPRKLGGTLLLVGASLSGLLSSGCDWLAEKASQKAAEAAVEHVLQQKTGGDVQFDSKKGVLTVKSDKGNVEINQGDGKLPSNWPEDVPIYPGAKIGMSVGVADHQQLLLETSDSHEKAIEFYKSKFSTWTQQFSSEVGGSQIARYKEESTGRVVQLTVGDKKGAAPPATVINLIVGAETKKKQKNR